MKRAFHSQDGLTCYRPSECAQGVIWTRLQWTAVGGSAYWSPVLVRTLPASLTRAQVMERMQ